MEFESAGLIFLLQLLSLYRETKGKGEIYFLGSSTGGSGFRVQRTCPVNNEFVVVAVGILKR
jgi:hypothetical protein